MAHRKAHPDEKGTESKHGAGANAINKVDRKAHPDEKGTERKTMRKITTIRLEIARPIPMKRELKAELTRGEDSSLKKSQGPSR